MKLYAGIDLHSNNSVLVVLDAHDKEVYRKRLPNDLGIIIEALQQCGAIHAVAVESTFNWYWLVDGLQEAGFDVRLVNTTAVKQYDGLKHGTDYSDARHLAHLLRLGILPTGYIYPRQGRAVRDLLSRVARMQYGLDYVIIPAMLAGYFALPNFEGWVVSKHWQLMKCRIARLDIYGFVDKRHTQN